ncbi:hypothetical protein DAKH74_014440 [Maudiozyma humilis]|uniref:Arrestin C-terminal-like domain-containing protein n=1 Tax=Maudiozyma humilis TaxID=51915 RepID=A0AAV5RTS2_MAUHU|nr:hypothetical protein DAKH74_014440 [Kazachstania humilis]
MHTITEDNAPIAPPERDVNHVLPGEKALLSTSSMDVYLQLVEPALFLRGFEKSSADPREAERAKENAPPPCILRGTVIVKLRKPTKFKRMKLALSGTARTDWPEGMDTLMHNDIGKVTMGDEFCEVQKLINNTWPFYNHDNVNVLNRNSDDTDDMDRIETVQHYSGAAIYRPPGTASSVDTGRRSSTNGSEVAPTMNTQPVDGMRSPSCNTSDSELSPANSVQTYRTASNPKMSKLSKSKSLNADASDTGTKQHSRRRGSFLADLLSSPFSHGSTVSSTTADSDGHLTVPGAPSSKAHVESGSDTPLSPLFDKDTFVFPAGEYVYPFEQLIPHSLPESVKVEYGQVKYELELRIKRFSMFKSSFTLTKPLQVVRSPSDSSVEESEPIVIAKPWKDKLKYNILINSRDVILDAFLPISIHLTPLDKITLYRTRIYITESIDYYARGKKLHRTEKAKKYLLAEHNGPFHDPGKGNRDKSNFRNYGNLLEEEATGDLVDKVFEYQVFVPKVFNGYKQLHPDTTNENLVVNHWIKISFRVSFKVDNVVKFFEVSIDSPVRVLHRLCSHANTLLPNYYSNMVTEPGEPDPTPISGPTANNLYHSSNIFFPKELCKSPVLSADMDVFDLTIPSVLQKDARNASANNAKDKRLSFSIGSLASSKNAKTEPLDDDNTRRHSIALINSPRMVSNIYQPLQLAKELAYPQAMPAFKSTVTVANSRAQTPPPPYEKRRHHSVPQSFTSSTGTHSSIESHGSSQIDLGDNMGVHFRNPNPFKKPTSTVFVPTSGSPSPESSRPDLSTFGFPSPSSSPPNYRRKSIAHEPSYRNTPRTLKTPRPLSCERYNSNLFVEVDADENDLTSVPANSNEWYPRPLN